MNSPSEEIPIESHRSWWKLHLLTWVMVLLVGGSLVLENLVGQYKAAIGRSWQDNLVFTFLTGWPFLFRTVAYHQEFNSLLSAINILIALAILASTTFTTESYLRRPAKWHQFSIQFILALTTFVALLLANAKHNLIRWRGDETWEYIPFIFIAVGLWCVFWMGWRLVAVGVSRIGGGVDDG